MPAFESHHHDHSVTRGCFRRQWAKILPTYTCLIGQIQSISNWIRVGGCGQQGHTQMPLEVGELNSNIICVLSGFVESHSACFVDTVHICEDERWWERGEMVGFRKGWVGCPVQACVRVWQCRGHVHSHCHVCPQGEGPCLVICSSHNGFTSSSLRSRSEAEHFNVTISPHSTF